MKTNLFYFYSFCDAAERWQLGLQDPATPAAEGMLQFHNYLLLIMILIGVFLFYILTIVLNRFSKENNPIPEKFTHSSILEIIWTLIPAVILIFIAIPSFSLLYSLEELANPNITLKIVGHQWYWTYEYSNYTKFGFKGNGGLNYDSYMCEDLVIGSFRLLEVDHRVVLPTNTHIRLLVTAADVLHSWAVPSFGVKVDGCPGRLSQAALYIKREGVYYGQCSEICGINHGFMPIVVRSVSIDTFVGWIYSKLDYYSFKPVYFDFFSKANQISKK